MNQQVPCEQVKAALTEYLLEEASAQLRQEVESHLPGCHACSQELAELRETLSLVKRAETAEEVPRKIRVVAEPVNRWAAFWQAPARLAFAGAGLFCVAIAMLALLHTTISYQNGNLQVAFGATALPAPAAPAAMPASATASLDRAQVYDMISQAVAAAQAEQHKQTVAMTDRAAQQIQLRWRQDLRDMGENLRYFQAAQTMLFKGQVQNQQLVSTLMQQAGMPQRAQ